MFIGEFLDPLLSTELQSPQSLVLIHGERELLKVHLGYRNTLPLVSVDYIHVSSGKRWLHARFPR